MHFGQSDSSSNRLHVLSQPLLTHIKHGKCICMQRLHEEW